VRLTSSADRATRLAAKEDGPAAGIVVLDRNWMPDLLRATVLPTDFDTDGVYPLSCSAVGLFRLREDAEKTFDGSFGLQFAVQMEAMQNRYTQRQVPRGDIEPLYQLASVMAAKFRARYDMSTFTNRLFEGLLTTWFYGQDAIAQFEASN
jgi:hypothetical protein